MRARDLVGRKIVKVNQSRWANSNCGDRWVIDSLVLDNGAVVTFTTVEGDGDYGTDVTVHRPQKKKILWDVRRDFGSEYFVVLRNGKEVSRWDTEGGAWQDMEKRIKSEG